mmetsp:Transcript_4737/g.9887  ORF Transcript_4737/g.9887 Transcript_4737/m.9887 type:complete len:164 (-) Transcript_4737:1073-1564(-)
MTQLPPPKRIKLTKDTDGEGNHCKTATTTTTTTTPALFVVDSVKATYRNGSAEGSSHSATTHNGGVSMIATPAMKGCHPFEGDTRMSSAPLDGSTIGSPPMMPSLSHSPGEQKDCSTTSCHSGHDGNGVMMESLPVLPRRPSFFDFEAPLHNDYSQVDIFQAL